MRVKVEDRCVLHESILVSSLVHSTGFHSLHIEQAWIDSHCFSREQDGRKKGWMRRGQKGTECGGETVIRWSVIK